jgi:Asp-tRNA(Asn)/Glu-tRNA(Gln) amidotransferase A subunit family amidase
VSLRGPAWSRSTRRRVQWSGAGLPVPAGLHGCRFAIWLEDEYCPVDAGVLRVLSSVVDLLEHTGARVAEARPCSLREAERLAQRLIQAVFSGAYPAAQYERLRVLAENAAVDDDSPPVRHARNVTVRSCDLSIAVEARAQLAARCATFFTEYDVIVNGTSRPYGDQIPWLRYLACVACQRWCCRPVLLATDCLLDSRSADLFSRIGLSSM